MTRRIKSISTAQEQILTFIQTFLSRNPYPPTIREIQKGCHISSTSVVNYNLNILEKIGILKRSGNVSRGLVLNRPNDTNLSTPRTISVPILGYIAAGEPIPVLESGFWGLDSAEIIEIPNNLIPHGATRKEVFALRVKGLSMIDALIDDGDIVLIESTPVAENGALVVAWLKEENEATLKRLYMKDGLAKLQPANSTMDPIYVNGENLEVKGVVLSVIRNTQKQYSI